MIFFVEINNQESNKIIWNTVETILHLIIILLF